MSRKHYIRTAEILSEVEDYDDRRRLAHAFAYMFQEDNVFFDRAKFLAACKVEVW